MNETQKKAVKRWAKILSTVTVGIILIVGMFMNITLCMAIVALIGICAIGAMIVYIIAERIYLWRVMGELTPEEWEIVKWYDYCLISNGAEWIADSLREEEKPEIAELFDRIEKNVKRPKIIS